MDSTHPHVRGKFWGLQSVYYTQENTVLVFYHENGKFSYPIPAAL